MANKPNSKSKVATVIAAPQTAQILPLDSLTRIRANKITKVSPYPLTAGINVKAGAQNPSRPGTTRALAFTAVCNCKTVADYKALYPAKLKYLGRWVAMGLIDIG